MSHDQADVLDFISLLLADKSEQTRRAYRTDLADFFQDRYSSEPTPELVSEFLALSPKRMEFAIAVYSDGLKKRNLSNATISRRLATVRSLLDFARQTGAAVAHVAVAIPKPAVRSYTDTTGLSVDQAKALLAQPNRATLRGKRDYAMLLLLLENALRSGELRALTFGSYRDGTLTLANGSKLSLNNHTAFALTDYIGSCGDRAEHKPLFTRLSSSEDEAPITGWGLQKVIRGYAKQAGIDASVNPRRLRHTSITTALVATDGDLAVVQQLSRHARSEAVGRYNDNRASDQAHVTSLLGNTFAPDEKDG